MRQVRIISIRPEAPGGGNTIARFDAEISADVRMFNLKLVRSRDGSLRVYAPSAYGTNVATFAPELAADLAAEAMKSLGEKTKNAAHAAA